MSEAPEDPNLKGGHAPAVKVGGMRVVSHKKEKPTEEAAPPQEEEDKEDYEAPAKTDKHHQQLLISGAVTKGDKDFPEAAVKAYHEKPHPTHDYNRSPQPKNQHRVIQQPRKQ